MSYPKLWVLIERGMTWGAYTIRHMAEEARRRNFPATTLVEYTPAPQWRPVSEINTRDWVLVYDGRYTVIASSSEQDGTWVDDEGNRLRPTHWQPLPAPPEVTP